LEIGQNNDMLKADSDEKQVRPQSNVLPPHVLKSIEKGLKQYEDGQTISLQEFKERHFPQK
jgi:hypothetical protein